MHIYKYILLGLLFLISLSLIFTKPGLNNFEVFSNQSYTTNFLEYPPGQYFILGTILKIFPLDKSQLTHSQDSWVVYKISIYLFYILTLVAILYLSKIVKSRLSLMDVTIAFFLSISIMLLIVILGFFEIFSAPFFILSITFLFKNKFNIAGLFYILSILFDWSILVLSPLFFIFFLRNKKGDPFKNITAIFGFLIVPSLLIIGFIDTRLDPVPSANNPFELSNLVGLPWLINQPFAYARDNLKMDLYGWMIGLFTVITTITSLGYLIKNIYLKKLNLNKKIANILSFAIPIAVFSLPIIWINSILHVLITFFITGSLFILNLFKSLAKISPERLLMASFCIYLVFIIFIPGVSEGSLLWLVLIILATHILNPSQNTKLLLILINLIVFISLYIVFGSSGPSRIMGDYYNFFRLIFSASFIIFAFQFFVSIYKNFFSLPLLNLSKWPIILILVVFNFSLIPAVGSPDTVSWTQYALASVEHINPFYAQTVVDQRYPPLSTVIQGGSGIIWNTFIGQSQTYAIATKLSIFIFYFLTVYLLIRFVKTFTLLDKLLIIMTTFSLIVQTQGLADLNIYVIPTLFASIITLFKKKYFLSGLLMGITISIKWQPMILIPLFFVTVFRLNDKFIISFKHLANFIIGLLPIPLISWYLVLMYPGGFEALTRSTDYLLHGAPMLSGQALNLNWIVTYIMHFFEVNVESLEHLGGLNRQIPTRVAPLIFQGYLFIAAFLIILLKYLFFGKKDIFNFLSTAVMIFFSHFMLNKSAYEKHLFYVVILMLFLYLLRPTTLNKYLLILFDIMVVMNLTFFYGFTGQKDIPRLIFGFDMTVVFSIYYLIVYSWVFWGYLKDKLLSSNATR